MFDIRSLDRNHALTFLEEDWLKNATYVIGIPVHPLGELSAFEHIFYGPADIESIRLRYIGISIQGLAHSLLLTIFIRNTFQAILLLCRKKDVLVAWCCASSSLIGVAYTLLATTTILFPSGPSCREVVWAASAGIVISSICISTALLQKAYIACERSKILLTVGTIMIIPQPIVTYLAMFSPVVFVPGSSCTLLYPTYFPWIKFSLDAPINTVFSVVFIIIVYRQYQKHGAKAWKRLAHTGIQTIALIILCNLVCMFAVTFEVLGTISELFFLIDWAITASLLIRHCLAMASAVAASTRSLSDSSRFVKLKRTLDTFAVTETLDTTTIDVNITYRRI
jgi:hypothetical protein